MLLLTATVVQFCSACLTLTSFSEVARELYRLHPDSCSNCSHKSKQLV